MGNEHEITKKMLDKLREHRYAQAQKHANEFIKEEKEDDNFLTRAKILMEEAVENKKKVISENEQTDNEHKKALTITKKTPQFGDVLMSQIEQIKKTLNDNIIFDDNALRYYPDADDLTIDGKIPSLNLKFQYRYNDPSTGCYIWCDAMVLNDENARMVGKIRDSYMNWKNSITQDADLLEKLKKYAEQTNE